MSKVIITQEQAEFIEGFKQEWYSDNDVAVKIGKELPMWAGRALHNLMQFGFGFPLVNADDKEMSNDEADPKGNFKHNQVPKLIEAIMNGYETETEKNVVLFMEFSDGQRDNRKLYYGAGIHVTNKMSATRYDLFIEWEAKKVEELKKQGWEVEEAE